MALPALRTERLTLRPFRRRDLDELTVLHAEPSFWWYPFRRGWTEDETEAFLDRAIDRYETEDFAVSAVVLRDDGRLAGWAGLSIPSFLPEVLPAVELGWRLGGAYRGQGYATEAGRAWLDYAFGPRGLDRLVSIHEPDNVASAAVAARLGFELAHETVHPSHGVALHVAQLERRRWEPSPIDHLPPVDLHSDR